MRSLRTIEDVVAWRLCLGCGACAYIAPEKHIRMVDVLEEGLRPQVGKGFDSSGDCLRVCPGVGLDYRHLQERPTVMPELFHQFGPVLEVWEGHATDEDIRFQGSSGGALTALSLYCLEAQGMGGVLHVVQSPEDATQNTVRLSKSREDLLAATGSRYAPAAVCEGLSMVDQAAAPCVVIAQPSEAAAIDNLVRVRPSLSSKVGLVLSFFCAGSPSRQGLLKLLSKLQVSSERLMKLRYRGKGWPGMFATTEQGDVGAKEHMTYAQSWDFLQRYRPYSTHLFPDGSGETSDISCGDPWYRAVQPGEHGSSLIVVRTERGRAVLHGAVAAGYLKVTRLGARELQASQSNLSKKRGAIWGRLVTFGLLGIPHPSHRGLQLFRNWRALSLGDKLRSFTGTVKRIVSRRYWRRSARQA